MMSVLSLAAMPFVHPGLAGAAAIAGLIPILVHLLNRRRYTRVRWAAMPFLLLANRRSATRLMLEQWLLLLLRIALIVLLGLAVARPYLPTSSWMPLGSPRVHRIVVLDNSLSMRTVDAEGRSRFDRARKSAIRLVSGFPDADAVSLLTLAKPATAVLEQPVYDRRFVRERLASVSLTQRAADPVGALDLAAKLVRDSRAASGNCVVYVVSDFPQSKWITEAGSTPSPAVVAARRLSDALTDAGGSLNFLPIGSEAVENVAVSRLDVTSPIRGVGIPIRLTVEVTNFGASSARNVDLQIRRGGQIIRRETLPRIDAGSSIETTVTVAFSTEGIIPIEARVVPVGGDALVDDDARFLSLEVRERHRILVVDGHPGPTLLAGEAGFLVTALAPQTATLNEASWDDRTRHGVTGAIEPRVISETQFDSEMLLEYDVVALCNVERLTTVQWRRLSWFVSRGGGLLLCLGDLVSTENYNRQGMGDGAGLLPGRLGSPRPTDVEDAIGLTLNGAMHPVVAAFANHPTSGLFTAQVWRYLPIDIPTASGEVLLSYTNGDAAMVASAHGRGRVVVWTTTANMTWNNLPARGDFVSLMLGTIAHLSARHGEHRTITVGDHLVEPLRSTEPSLALHVTTSMGAAGKVSLVPIAAARINKNEPRAEHLQGDANMALALSFGPVEEAGMLTASIGSSDRLFAANVDPSESNLHATSPESLLAAMGRPVRLLTEADIGSAMMSAEHSGELAHIALWCAVVLAFVEMWLAMWWGSRRAMQN